MAGLPLLPTTLIAAVVALLLTSEAGLIHTQQRRRDLVNGEANATPEAVLPHH
jgi:hypothetical protein